MKMLRSNVKLEKFWRKSRHGNAADVPGIAGDRRRESATDAGGETCRVHSATSTSGRELCSEGFSISCTYTFTAVALKEEGANWGDTYCAVIAGLE